MEVQLKTGLLYHLIHGDCWCTTTSHRGWIANTLNSTCTCCRSSTQQASSYHWWHSRREATFSMGAQNMNSIIKPLLHSALLKCKICRPWWNAWILGKKSNVYKANAHVSCTKFSGALFVFSYLICICLPDKPLLNHLRLINNIFNLWPLKESNFPLQHHC